MAKQIAKIAKPIDYDNKSNYAFFERIDSKRKYKTKVIISKPDPMNTGITVTVSPIDETGKALIENGEPVIIDSWTHTFNSVEMSEPSFDPKQRVLDITEERISVGEMQFKGKKKIENMISTWGAN